MRDDAILALYLSRNESAIAESERTYGAYCQAIASRILPTREDSEEAVADTWWQAWRAIPPDMPTVLRLYFGRITRNRAVSRLRTLHAARRGGGEYEAALEELSDCASPEGVEDAVSASEIRAALEAFLTGLPQRDCAIFLRRYFYVESTAAIARRFGLREAHVRTILSRNREKLRIYLTKEGLL